MQLCDRDIMAQIAPRMRGFSPGVSGTGVISYGLTSGGYDFRLGETVKAFSPMNAEVIDPLDIDPALFVPLKVATLTREYPGLHKPVEYRYVTIPPNSYVLAETVEWIDIPDNIEITLVGKSTYARCGIILNCTPLEPGWRGRVTLEIENAAPVPARLYVGMGIAQGLFNVLSGVPDKTYSKRGGKYQDQTGLAYATVIDPVALAMHNGAG